MESLPNNSGNPNNRETQKNVPDTPRNGVSHRPTFIKLVRDAFVPSDVENAGSYILSEMIVPSIRDGVFDIVQGMVDYWRTGVGGYSRRVSGRVNTGDKLMTQKQNYTSYSKQSRISQNYANVPTADRPSSYEDLFLEDIDIIDDATGAHERVTGVARAINCLEDCRDDIRKYGRCRISDLYEHLQQTPKYTDYSYGWVNLDDAGWKAGRGGAWLIMPKALPIDEV